jgi:transposase
MPMTAIRIAELEAMNAALVEANAALQKKFDDVSEKLEVLLHRVAQMSRRMYSAVSERHHPGQQSFFDVAPVAADPTLALDAAKESDATIFTGVVPADAPTQPKRRGGKKPGQGRQQVPAHLEIKTTYVEIPESERIGLDGQPLVKIDIKTVIKLDYIPGGFVARHIITPIYGVPWQDGEVGKIYTPVPACIVPQGKATDELILHLLLAKYGWHLPLHRLEEQAREAGVELPRSTIMDWLRRATDLLAPVAEAIKSETLAAAVLHTDETPVRQMPKREIVPTPGRDSGNGKRKRPGKCTTARFWVYRSSTAVWYHYTENRQGIHPQTILADYTGFVVADAYAGFDKIFNAGKSIEIACWAHTRRKFYESLYPPQHNADTDLKPSPSAAPDPGDPRAEQALSLIRQLYNIERDIAQHTSDQRHAHRQTHSKPILAALKIKLDAWKIACRPTEPLAKAVTYALNQWLALSRFIDNGIAPIDNNPAENSLRTIAVGRKNWLFIGSPEGGASAAIAYTLIQTAKINGLNAATYLADTVAALLKKCDPKTLTPAHIAAQKAAASAA